MRRTLLTIITLVALLTPQIQTSAQSGDATWLEGIDGLQTAIGRSWMAPMQEVTESTVTELNDLGTPISSTTTVSTPEPVEESEILMLSALVFELDSAKHANEALQLMNAEQVSQLERDPRAPEMNEFLPENLGDMAYGHEGSYPAPGMDVDLAVVYLMVQDGPYVYQTFGMFQSGDHIGIATGIAEDMIAAEPGDGDPIYDVAGISTGGNWEILNAIELDMSEGSFVNDLEVYPVDPNSVIGDSQVVPQIDLTDLAAIPGLSGSWSVTYQSHALTELVGSPVASPDGVYNIELWVLEFSDPTNASAAAFAMDVALTEPLGVVSTEGSGFETRDGETGITLINTGFVRDRALPEGDAATVVTVTGTTVYAARVYANGPAPTPLAQKLVQHMVDTEPGSDTEVVDGTVATGGMWTKFPASGSELVAGLEVIVVLPSAPPVATPN
ncbi:MAG: hypothetical protein M9950_11550 [Thermomicrobiales bacterium]|nr:hypothetical protein [Thermomicrobiales bacterium]